MINESPELVLWRTVISQAIIDACNISNRKHKSHQKEFERDKKEAREWLLGGSEDFQEVCALAQVEWESVQDQARMLRDLKWKMPEEMKLNIYVSRFHAPKGEVNASAS